MRVHVTIPGTVESYCVDERGEKRKASDDLWLETYLCSVLRAYSYADDGSGDSIRKIVGVRRFNPVTNTETEHRFLNSAEQLFFRGIEMEESEVLYNSRLTPCRVAARIRFNRPGPYECIKSSHHWTAEVSRDYWPLYIRYQPLREASHSKRRSRLTASKGDVHGS